ncbi:MAG: hypothetical protein H7831_17860 [Magnetococcus sp. WYHC-3]
MFISKYGAKTKVAVSFDKDKEPSRTKQAHRDECDINRIMGKYHKTGVITNLNRTPAVYGDFSRVQSYQDAINIVFNAEHMFSQLPAKLRAQFDNDPAVFLAYAENPLNRAKMAEMGLLGGAEGSDKGSDKKAEAGQPEPGVKGV